MDKVEKNTEDVRVCEEVWELITCGGYNSSVDDIIVKVMECIKTDRPIYVTDIADKLKLQDDFVELIQYIICSLDYAEYGTSPRGCWLTNKGEKMLDIFKQRQKLYEN
jgi:Mn-dependent DtxR family transcriptional regulator